MPAVNKISFHLVFLRILPILLKYLENTFQVFLQGNTMTNAPETANETPKTPDQAPAKPAQQDQGNQSSKPSEQQK